MPRNYNQPDRRLGQVDNMVRNTQDERQERLNRLLGRNIEEETIEPRNRRERRERGITENLTTSNNYETVSELYGSISTQARESLSAISISPTYIHNFSREYSPSFSVDWNREYSGSFQFSQITEPITPKYIKQHNYAPSKFNFNHTETDCNEKCTNLYMGVELEIDQGGESDDNAKFIQEYLGEDNCYIMHDGSLSKGLEITTHPCSLNYHKSLKYEGLFKELVAKGYKSHDTQTCGLHVHINRNFFGEDPTMQDLCITKVLYLLEKHWDSIKAIARRDSSRYAERFFMKEDESLFNLLAKAKGTNSGMFSNAKYQIVNLLHKNTIEFRLFKGTLKYETFIATLEFVRNLVYLCKNKPLEQIQMTTFEEIIYSLDSEYLISYTKEREITLVDKVAI